jgi:serine/threonine-protein kinase RsbW
MQDELVIELHSELPEIARLAGQVEAFGVRNNVPAIAIGHVNLALDELITNTISYGVVDGRSHRIRVTLRLDHGKLAVEILDNGRPFAPFGADDPDVTQSIEDRPIGGLGIYFAQAHGSCGLPARERPESRDVDQEHRDQEHCA